MAIQLLPDRMIIEAEEKNTVSRDLILVVKRFFWQVLLPMRHSKYIKKPVKYKKEPLQIYNAYSLN